MNPDPHDTLRTEIRRVLLERTVNTVNRRIAMGDEVDFGETYVTFETLTRVYVVYFKPDDPAIRKVG